MVVNFEEEIYLATYLEQLLYIFFEPLSITLLVILNSLLNPVPLIPEISTFIKSSTKLDWALLDSYNSSFSFLKVSPFY
jgi:hypothetical protein